MLLSEKELQIIHNTDFLKTKISVFKKLHTLFENVRVQQKEVINNTSFNFLSNVDTKTGKIFKGENYNSLPYLVLDYPKLYSKLDTFSFRTMFLWGNFYSSTLHLDGNSFQKYKCIIASNLKQIISNNYEVYICVNASQWEYHYENDNYILLNNDNLEIIENINFLKISTRINLDEYNNLPFHSSKFLNDCLMIMK